MQPKCCPSHGRQAYAVQDTWTRLSPAGIEHLCHADIWNEWHLVQHHYFSAFVAFQAACRQEIVWMHHCFLGSQACVMDSFQSARRTCVQQCTPTEPPQHSVGGLSGLCGPNTSGTVTEKDIDVSNVSWKGPNERLRSCISPQDIVCSRTAVQNAAIWAAEFLSWQHSDLARADVTACTTTTPRSSGSQASPVSHLRRDVSQAPEHADAPPFCCIAMTDEENNAAMDWLVLSGIDLHCLLDHTGTTTSSIHESMRGLRLALLAVLQADAASEYHGKFGLSDTKAADVGVRCSHSFVQHLVVLVLSYCVFQVQVLSMRWLCMSQLIATACNTYPYLTQADGM